MRNIFTNPQLQKEFDKKGFVVVDLLTPSEVEQARALQTKYETKKFQDVPDYDITYKLSFFGENEAHKRKAFEEVNAFFKDKVDRFLDRYKPVMTNLFEKEPGTGEVPVHQNWTFVDESKYTSVSVWCPLVDVTHENGTLEVVPGTHKVMCDVRSPSIHVVFMDLIDIAKQKYMEPFNLKAGQAAIVDDGALHYSPVNVTSKPRPAIQLIMAPEDAQLIHYYKSKDSKEDKVEIYEVSPEFFFTFNITEPPQNVKRIGFKDYKHRDLTELELQQMIARTRQPETV